MNKCACKGSFLDKFVQPSVLLILSAESLHGFSILKKLCENKIIDYSSIDPTGFYRTLKKMEENSLISSTWEVKGSSKPIKIFSITKNGKECLKTWAHTLAAYRESIELLENEIDECIKNHCL